MKQFLELPHGIPSHDTFARVFGMLQPEAVNRCFHSWIEALAGGKGTEVINVDGKTARRSYDTRENKSALHMVSAWANKAGLVLGQKGVDEKSNEITAIPELLEALEIEGCVVTIDAMGTQKEIAEKICNEKGNYLLALKGNQGTLKEDVALYFQGEEKTTVATDRIDYYKTVDTGHGRVETREDWVTGDMQWLYNK